MERRGGVGMEAWAWEGGKVDDLRATLLGLCKIWEGTSTSDVGYLDSTDVDLMYSSRHPTCPVSYEEYLASHLLCEALLLPAGCESNAI